MLGVDSGSVVEGVAFGGVLFVFGGRLVGVFGVFAENGLVAVNWLFVGRLRVLLLERSVGSV